MASCGAYTVLWNFRCVVLRHIRHRRDTGDRLCQQASVRTDNVRFCVFCRQVKLAESAVQSYGGLTTVTDYHLIPRQEDVVDSTFMHDNYASPGARWAAGRCTRLEWPCSCVHLMHGATLGQRHTVARWHT